MAERGVGAVRVDSALAAFAALVRAGEDCLGEAQRRAPIEEGTLRASGELGFIVNGIVYQGDGAAAAARADVASRARLGTLQTMEFTVSFNEIYAARQHEETEWNHPLGGQAKYLESVMLERGERYTRAAQRAFVGALD